MITIILSHFTVFLEMHFWSKEYLHDKYFQVVLYKGVLFSPLLQCMNVPVSHANQCVVKLSDPCKQ